MTTTPTPLDLYRERIPVARAAFDAAFGLLPVPQRRRDMARRLWQQVHAQVPEMPVPWVNLDGECIQFVWNSERYSGEAVVPSYRGGYWLWWSDMQGAIVFEPDTYSIEPLLRVCQRFVAATAREVR